MGDARRCRCGKKAAIQSEQGHELAAARPGLEIAVFVEQGLIPYAGFAERGPIDLPPQQRLGIQLAPPRQRGAFQLADGHAVLVEDAQLELVDDGAFRRAGLMQGQAEIAGRRRAPVEVVVIAVAGGDAADLAKALAVIRQVHRKDGAVGLAPVDQRPQR